MRCKLRLLLFFFNAPRLHTFGVRKAPIQIRFHYLLAVTTGPPDR